MKAIKILIFSTIVFILCSCSSSIERTIDKAVKNNSPVLITYQKENGVQSQRVISNIHYVELYGRSGYIHAFCHLRNDWRTFKISRIQSAEIVSLTDNTGDTNIFSFPYFWFCIISSLFLSQVLKLSCNFRGASSFIQSSLVVVGGLATIALAIFLILGFFYMPHWWYPLVILLIAIIVDQFNPIPYEIGGLLGLIIVPILTILSYIYLF